MPAPAQAARSRLRRDAAALDSPSQAPGRSSAAAAFAETNGTASKSIVEALKSGAQGSALDLGQFEMYRAQGQYLIMDGLAAANDSKAYELCESLRAKFLDRKVAEQSLDTAQVAAAAALSALSKP